MRGYFNDVIALKVSVGAGDGDQVVRLKGQMQAGLIAYRRPFYQALSLEPETPGVLASAPAVPPIREGGMRAVGDVLRSLLAQKEEGGR